MADIWYPYRGNVFRLHRETHWREEPYYTITGIRAAQPVLALPPFCGELAVLESCVTGGALRGADIVSVLSIPASIEGIDLYNETPAFWKFHALRRVEVASENHCYFSDGKMLFSADGRRLFYSLAAGNASCAVIPKHVKRIERFAFYKTACPGLSFENSAVRVASGAFDGSGWLKAQGPYAVIGDLFYRLCEETDRLAVPDCVRRYQGDAFQSAAPEVLSVRELPPPGILRSLLRHPNFKRVEQKGAVLDRASLSAYIETEKRKKRKTED